MEYGLDHDVLIIGAGMSGVGMAIQLLRQYGDLRLEIIEKANSLGGTWAVNTYPGCGCDVPSHFYSYSFAPNPEWTRKFSLQPEIRNYFYSVASSYNIPAYVRLGREVIRAEWQDVTGNWMVTIYDLELKRTYSETVKILMSAVGSLSTPKMCEIRGAEHFGGSLFHSARWDHTFDYRGKDVVVVGNGCSATQFVPAISKGLSAVNKVTQFSRQAHWLSERPNPEYSFAFRWVMRWVPGAMRAYRTYLYILQESGFIGIPKETGVDHRQEWTKAAVDYIKRSSPSKYHDALVPKSEIGCKRRVMDTGYLDCLGQENVELIWDDPIDEIIHDGVHTQSGRFIHADAVILATGFETQKPLHPIDIRGRGGVSIAEHWAEFGDGSPEAYFGTCLSNFPNFFIMMGPNTLSGHLSVIFTSECQFGFTMRVLGPILKNLRPPLLSRLLGYHYPDIVSTTREAEKKRQRVGPEKSETTDMVIRMHILVYR